MSRRSQLDNVPTLSGHAKIEKAKNMIETARREFKIAFNMYRKNPSKENQELLDQTRNHLLEVYDEFKVDVIFSWLNSPEMYRHNLRSRVV
jgi:DNA-binding transcriptional ArsR family regulator